MPKENTSKKYASDLSDTLLTIVREKQTTVKNIGRSNAPYSSAPHLKFARLKNQLKTLFDTSAADTHPKEPDQRPNSAADPHPKEPDQRRHNVEMNKQQNEKKNNESRTNNVIFNGNDFKNDTLLTTENNSRNSDIESEYNSSDVRKKPKSNDDYALPSSYTRKGETSRLDKITDKVTNTIMNRENSSDGKHLGFLKNLREEDSLRERRMKDYNIKRNINSIHHHRAITNNAPSNFKVDKRENNSTNLLLQARKTMKQFSDHHYKSRSSTRNYYSQQQWTSYNNNYYYDKEANYDYSSTNALINREYIDYLIKNNLLLCGRNSYYDRSDDGMKKLTEIKKVVRERDRKTNVVEEISYKRIIRNVPSTVCNSIDCYCKKSNAEQKRYFELWKYNTNNNNRNSRNHFTSTNRANIDIQYTQRAKKITGYTGIRLKDDIDESYGRKKPSSNRRDTYSMSFVEERKHQFVAAEGQNRYNRNDRIYDDDWSIKSRKRKAICTSSQSTCNRNERIDKFYNGNNNYYYNDNKVKRMTDTSNKYENRLSYSEKMKKSSTRDCREISNVKTSSGWERLNKNAERTSTILETNEKSSTNKRRFDRNQLSDDRFKNTYSFKNGNISAVNNYVKDRTDRITEKYSRYKDESGKRKKEFEYTTDVHDRITNWLKGSDKHFTNKKNTYDTEPNQVHTEETYKHVNHGTQLPSKREKINNNNKPPVESCYGENDIEKKRQKRTTDQNVTGKTVEQPKYFHLSSTKTSNVTINSKPINDIYEIRKDGSRVKSTDANIIASSTRATDNNIEPEIYSKYFTSGIDIESDYHVKTMLQSSTNGPRTNDTIRKYDEKTGNYDIGDDIIRSNLQMNDVVESEFNSAENTTDSEEYSQYFHIDGVEGKCPYKQIATGQISNDLKTYLKVQNYNEQRDPRDGMITKSNVQTPNKEKIEFNLDKMQEYSKYFDTVDFKRNADGKQIIKETKTSPNYKVQKYNDMIRSNVQMSDVDEIKFNLDETQNAEGTQEYSQYFDSVDFKRNTDGKKNIPDQIIRGIRKSSNYKVQKYNEKTGNYDIHDGIISSNVSDVDEIEFNLDETQNTEGAQEYSQYFNTVDFKRNADGKKIISDQIIEEIKKSLNYKVEKYNEETGNYDIHDGITRSNIQMSDTDEIEFNLDTIQNAQGMEKYFHTLGIGSKDSDKKVIIGHISKDLTPLNDKFQKYNEQTDIYDIQDDIISSDDQISDIDEIEFNLDATINKLGAEEYAQYLDTICLGGNDRDQKNIIDQISNDLTAPLNDDVQKYNEQTDNHDIHDGSMIRSNVQMSEVDEIEFNLDAEQTAEGAQDYSQYFRTVVVERNAGGKKDQIIKETKKSQNYKVQICNEQTDNYDILDGIISSNIQMSNMDEIEFNLDVTQIALRAEEYSQYFHTVDIGGKDSVKKGIMGRISKNLTTPLKDNFQKYNNEQTGNYDIHNGSVIRSSNVQMSAIDEIEFNLDAEQKAEGAQDYFHTVVVERNAGGKKDEIIKETKKSQNYKVQIRNERTDNYDILDGIISSNIQMSDMDEIEFNLDVTQIALHAEEYSQYFHTVDIGGKDSVKKVIMSQISKGLTAPLKDNFQKYNEQTGNYDIHDCIMTSWNAQTPVKGEIEFIPDATQNAQGTEKYPHTVVIGGEESVKKVIMGQISKGLTTPLNDKIQNYNEQTGTHDIHDVIITSSNVQTSDLDETEFNLDATQNAQSKEEYFRTVVIKRNTAGKKIISDQIAKECKKFLKVYNEQTDGIHDGIINANILDESNFTPDDAMLNAEEEYIVDEKDVDEKIIDRITEESGKSTNRKFRKYEEQIHDDGMIYYSNDRTDDIDKIEFGTRNAIIQYNSVEEYNFGRTEKPIAEFTKKNDHVAKSDTRLYDKDKPLKCSQDEKGQTDDTINRNEKNLNATDVTNLNDYMEDRSDIFAQQTMNGDKSLFDNRKTMNNFEKKRSEVNEQKRKNRVNGVVRNTITNSNEDNSSKPIPENNPDENSNIPTDRSLKTDDLTNSDTLLNESENSRHDDEEKKPINFIIKQTNQVESEKVISISDTRIIKTREEAFEEQEDNYNNRPADIKDEIIFENNDGESSRKSDNSNEKPPNENRIRQNNTEVSNITMDDIKEERNNDITSKHLHKTNNSKDVTITVDKNPEIEIGYDKEYNNNNNNNNNSETKFIIDLSNKKVDITNKRYESNDIKLEDTILKSIDLDKEKNELRRTDTLNRTEFSRFQRDEKVDICNRTNFRQQRNYNDEYNDSGENSMPIDLSTNKITKFIPSPDNLYNKRFKNNSNYYGRNFENNSITNVAQGNNYREEREFGSKYEQQRTGKTNAFCQTSPMLEKCVNLINDNLIDESGSREKIRKSASSAALLNETHIERTVVDDNGRHSECCSCMGENKSSTSCIMKKQKLENILRDLTDINSIIKDVLKVWTGDKKKNQRKATSSSE